MNEIFWAVLLSILPIAELRGGIPYGLATIPLTLNNVLTVFSLCVLANILVVIPLFFFLDFFHHRFIRFGWYSSLFNFFVKRIQKKSHKLEPKINKYGYIALAVFVAVPLPMTGAWAGTLAAWLLDLNRKKSFAAITAGVLIAGIIVTLITLGGLGIFKFAFS